MSANAELGLIDVAAVVSHSFKLFPGEIDRRVVRTVNGPNGDLFQKRVLAQRLFLHRLPTDDRHRRGEKVRTPLQNPPHAFAAGAEARRR